MNTFRVTLQITNSANAARSWTQDISISETEGRDIPQEVASVVLAHLNMHEQSGAYLPDFEPCTDLYDDSMSFDLTQMFTTGFERRMNPNEIWFETQNILLQSRIVFSHSRALKEFEAGASDKNTLYNTHFDKMDRFHIGVYLLTKVEDLVCRAIFEALDATLIAVDMTEPEWERSLTWRNTKNALKNRSANELLRNMGDPEYQQLLAVFVGFSNPAFVGEFRRYRDAITHRITPSVDYPELYVEIADRLWQVHADADGKMQSATKLIGAAKKDAQYSFLDLYALAKNTYSHYLKQLHALKAALGALY